MITCGGQATVPMVHAVSSVVPVPYAEIVASVSSRSAGPGTRANIDEFTETTAAAVEAVGGAQRGKAIIILNPVEPPLMMRNTVFCAIPAEAGEPGALQDRSCSRSTPWCAPSRSTCPATSCGPTPSSTPPERRGAARPVSSSRSRCEGRGDYLPDYAGNLDIITAAAARVGDLLMAHRLGIEASWKSSADLGDVVQRTVEPTVTGAGV
jgi:acetaldehyde dehydrogenase